MCTMFYALVKSVQYCTHFFSLQYEIYINSKYKLIRHGELCHFDSNFQPKKKNPLLF